MDRPLIWRLESRLETRSSTTTTIDLVLVSGGARFEVVPRPDRRFRVWVGSDVRRGHRHDLHRRSAGGGRARLGRAWRRQGGLGSGRDAAVRRNRRGRRHRAKRTARAVAEGAQSRREAAAARVDDEPGRCSRLRSNAAQRAPQTRTSANGWSTTHPRDPRAPYAAFILGASCSRSWHRPREAASAFAKVESAGSRRRRSSRTRSPARSNPGHAPATWKRARQRAGAYLGRYPNGRRSDEVRRYSRME